MVAVAFAPQFCRQFRKLPTVLQEEVFEKISLFKELGNHTMLRVHKLKGAMKGRSSFSANYRYRIVFMWEKKNISAILLAIGDHAVYD
jgi:plasmid maintenance system killer protein